MIKQIGFIMRVVVQRVLRAQVSVSGRVVSHIGPGLVCLTGLCKGDSEQELEWMANKLLGLRLWPDGEGRAWKSSVRSDGLDVLLVSQFTLYGNLDRGTKPDFHSAMPNAEARVLYATFVDLMRAKHSERVFDGEFAAKMQVELVNDGPITFTIDSPAPRPAAGGTLALTPTPTPTPTPSPPPVPEGADVVVLLRRASKKLAKVQALKERMERGAVKQVDAAQQAKLATEPHLLAQVLQLKAVLDASEQKTAISAISAISVISASATVCGPGGQRALSHTPSKSPSKEPATPSTDQASSSSSSTSTATPATPATPPTPAPRPPPQS